MIIRIEHSTGDYILGTRLSYSTQSLEEAIEIVRRVQIIDESGILDNHPIIYKALENYKYSVSDWAKAKGKISNKIRPILIENKKILYSLLDDYIGEGPFFTELD
jgi:hypothetical protein